jgi:anaerobic magnesium-protoporphyrin IX monomethyl ester cyclase
MIVKEKILLITGTPPNTVSKLKEMGMVYEPLVLLMSMAGKNTFHSSIPSLGATVLGTYLKEQGIQVEIADFYVDTLESYDADIVGISSTFCGIDDVRIIANSVREKNPKAIIVLGGALAWSVPPATLLEIIPNIDYIVQREGEQTFTELIKVIRNNVDPHSVAGLIFKRNNTVIETPQRVSMNFKEVPNPDWTLMHIPSPKRFPVLPIETSRGCPYNCAYCSEVTYWGKPVRYSTINKVIEEILYDAEKFGITSFRFSDSCFSAPPERNAEICDAIYEKCIKTGIPVKWSSYARIENLDETILEKMKRSGCIALDIGLESGSIEVLRRMGRGYSPEAAVKAAKAAKKVDILTNFNIVVGFPSETQKTINDTIELINRASPDTFTTFLFYLAPHTRAYKDLNQFELTGDGAFWKHNTMNSGEAVEAMFRLVKEVTNSVSFPAGEHIASYLASCEYSTTEIRGVFTAINKLIKNRNDETSISVIKRMNEKIGHLW